MNTNNKIRRLKDQLNEVEDIQGRSLLALEDAVRDEANVRAHGLRELSNRCDVIPGLVRRIEELEHVRIEADVKEAMATTTNEVGAPICSEAGHNHRTSSCLGPDGTAHEDLVQDLRHGGLFETKSTPFGARIEFGPARGGVVQSEAVALAHRMAGDLVHDAMVLAERRALGEAVQRVRALLENTRHGVSLDFDQIFRAVRGKDSAN